MSIRRLRTGERLALAGGVCVIASLFMRAYESPAGGLDGRETFGPAVALMLVGALAALLVALSALTERSSALPVATAVWGVLLGLAAAISAVIRVLERPDHATSPAAGAWLALAGALAALLGAWLSLRDEHGLLYEPVAPDPRPAPPAAPSGGTGPGAP